jgi:hypothetical protein
MPEQHDILGQSILTTFGKKYFLKGKNLIQRFTHKISRGKRNGITDHEKSKGWYFPRIQ